MFGFNLVERGTPNGVLYDVNSGLDVVFGVSLSGLKAVVITLIIKIIYNKFFMQIWLNDLFSMINQKVNAKKDFSHV